ncbi:MAG: pre-peptidase C-terminal domain-containing protein [Magnetococcales bacterium]|nr:pre-peptidase C-terminal domain-containing protein [Magnetococcales bacterium]
MSDTILDSTATSYYLYSDSSAGYSTIDALGDQDWWSIYLNAGTSYTFHMDRDVNETQLDPYLRLLDASGNQLAFNDDYITNNSTITYTPTWSGTFYLSAQSFYTYPIGNYSIYATSTPATNTDLIGSTTATASYLPASYGSATSQIDTVGDQDWWSVSLSAGTTYTFRMDATTTMLNPVLYLLDSSGNQKGYSDDSNGTQNAEITFVATTSETYYLSAQGNYSTTGGYTVSTSSVTTVSQPELSIWANSTTWNEGNNNITTSATFTVARTGDTTGYSYVSWNVISGATASALDFSSLYGMPSGGISFSPGETSQNLTVDILGDNDVEPNEDFYVTLSGASGATLGTASAMATIVNDDYILPMVSISASGSSASEGNSGTTAMNFTVLRSGDTSVASTVGWNVSGSGSSAATARDFSGNILPSGTVSFHAGQTSQTLTVNVAGDTTVEPDEAFLVVLSNVTGATLGTSSAQGTIRNDDVSAPPPVLSISAVNASGNEGNSGSTPMSFTVSRTGDTTVASMVDWAVTGSGASAATARDFSGGVLPSGSLNFAVGQSSQTITINIAGDATVEQDEGFTVTLASPTGATIGTASASAQIRNDDSNPLPVLSITATSASGNEGNSGTTPMSFTVSRTGDTTVASTVGWAVTGSGTSAATARDFSGGILPSGTLNFAAGQSSQTLTVNVSGDATVEPDDGFTVTLANPTGATLGTASATGVIRNDDTDAIPGTTATTSVLTINGTAGSSQIDNATDQDWWRVALNADTSYTFRLATTTASLDTYLRLLDDTGVALVEDNEGDGAGNTQIIYTPDTTGTYYLSAQGFGGSTGAYTLAATVPAPVLNLTATNARRTEGNSGSTAMTFTVARTGDTGVASSVAWAVTGSGTTAATARDFTGGALPSGTLNFTAGQSSQILTVNVSGDTTVEPDEGFTVTLSNPTGATLGTATATGQIRNDDTDTIPGTTATISTLAINGAAGSSLIDNATDQDWWRVSLDADTTYTFRLTTSSTSLDTYLRLLDGTGTLLAEDNEGDGSGNTQLLYTPSASATFYLSAQGFGATTGGYALTATAVAPEPVLNIAATSTGVNEGNSGSTPISFTVERTGDDSDAATVNWAVTGSGTNPASARDFAGGILPTGTVNFAAGEITQTILVNIAGDATFEPNDSFTVTLSEASGATIGTASATATILNDDVSATARTLTLSGSSTVSEGSAATYTVTLSATSTTATTVNYAAASGTAIAGSDFTATSGTLTIAAGSRTATFTVPTLTDTRSETGETFTVSLSNPGSGATLGTSAVTTTITNVTSSTNTDTGTGLVESSTSHTLADGVANLTLTGTAAINGTGNALNNVITGNDAINTLRGEGGNDRLLGRGGNDLLFGGAGNDELNGGAGADQMTGGAGDDTYVVGIAGDTITEATDGGTDLVQSSITWTLGSNLENLTLTGVTAINATGNVGNNTLTGNTGDNTLTGGEGNDTLSASDGDDTLFGGAGDDVLDGGLGADRMVGDAGNDTYVVNHLDDTVTEGATTGTDLVQSAVTWTLATNLENLTLTGTRAINGIGNAAANTVRGNSAANMLQGQAGADVLYGRGGLDILKGDAGTDQLIGGIGQDTLTGGADADQFKFTLPTEGDDIISDFNATEGDQLVFVSENFGNIATGKLGSSRFALNTTGRASSTSHRFVFNTSNGTLRYDPDGSGTQSAVTMATLTGVTALTINQIQIVAS